MHNNANRKVNLGLLGFGWYTTVSTVTGLPLLARLEGLSEMRYQVSTITIVEGLDIHSNDACAVLLRDWLKLKILHYDWLA